MAFALLEDREMHAAEMRNKKRWRILLAVLVVLNTFTMVFLVAWAISVSIQMDAVATAVQSKGQSFLKDVNEVAAFFQYLQTCLAQTGMC